MTSKHIAFKPYSDHPDDHYLSIVLHTTSSGEYVTHVYNSQDEGYYHGHYHGKDFQAAREDFNKRGQKL